MPDTLIPSPESEPVLSLWPIPAKAFGMSRPKAYNLAQRGNSPARCCGSVTRWFKVQDRRPS